MKPNVAGGRNISRFRLRLRFAAMALAVVFVGKPIHADDSAFKPFVVDHRAAELSSLNLSFLLDAPAGADGPLRIEGGHFIKPNGKRFKIWGVNITAFAAGSVHFPDKEDADFWAETLARYGVNCVRLHAFDVEAPRGIIAAGSNSTCGFDANQVDRMDYFVASLKRHGIYTDLNLNVSRTYKQGDGVRDYELIGPAKALTYFDPRLIALQREYAHELLTHYNPYTRSEYRNEPAIAIVEIVNENTLVGSWIRGRLMGKKTSGPAQSWQDIPPYYEQELTGLYNQWLHTRASGAKQAEIRKMANVGAEEPVSRLQPADFASAPELRFATEAEFYMEIEESFFREMRTYLKDTIGVKALLIGTSDYSYGRSSYASLKAMQSMDIIDSHGPWELNAMVNEPGNSVPVRVSRAALAGKPFTVTEHNHRFPGDYTCEGIPLLAAYGGFQDWDGIFLYTFEMKPRGYLGRIESRADLSHDPVKLANLAAGALLFLRGDITPALDTITRSYSTRQVIDALRLQVGEAGVFFTPGFPATLPLRHGVRIGSLDGQSSIPGGEASVSPIRSDTGELSWRYPGQATRVTLEDDQKFSSRATEGGRNLGLVTINTARSQGVVGFPGGGKVAVDNMTINVTNRFATVILTSLDGLALADSKRMLLVATARVTNSDATWNAAHSGFEKWGGSPTLIEPVGGFVTIRGLALAKNVRCVALDGAGCALPTEVPVERTAEGWRVSLGIPTTWYCLTVAQ